MKEAVKKLKELAEDNIKTADLFEKEDWIGAEQMTQERVTNLVKTYRYWSQCLYMAAWLLEQDISNK